jgi:hypothetical protein
MHRYDACFQIKVGAWMSDKPRYAYGNVLTWKHLVENGRYRKTPNGHILLSDNKGTTWHSGAYGANLSEHVLGAWQIYQHSGDTVFLRECYDGYFRKVFWNGIIPFAMNQFEVAEVLERMAGLTGFADDAEHWRRLVNRDPEHIRRMFDQRWEMNGHADYFAGPRNGMLMTNGFWPMRSRHFPREYAERMVAARALDREQGFFGDFFPLAMARQSMRSFASDVDHSFGYTPDTAYFTLDGMFRQGLGRPAWELTLNHLSHYNYHDDWGIPVAPEAYRRNGSLFGDQYSNFNAGKILLFLEGLCGLEYSIPENRFHVRDTMPETWDWMEVRFPRGIGRSKGPVRVRYERKREDGSIRKGIQVTGCPLPVTIGAWSEGREPRSMRPSPPGIATEIETPAPGYRGYRFKASTQVAVGLSIPSTQK